MRGASTRQREAWTDDRFCDEESFQSPGGLFLLMGGILGLDGSIVIMPRVPI